MSQPWEKIFDNSDASIDLKPSTEQLITRVQIDKELIKRMDDEEIHNYISEYIAREFVQVLLKSGLIQIINLTLEEERNGGFPPYGNANTDLLNTYYNRGEITFEGKLNLNVSPKGADCIRKLHTDQLKRNETKVIYKDQFTQEQLDYIWKLLPPRINKRDPSQHPLNRGWFGTIERPGDEKIRKVLSEALKQDIK